MFNNEQRMRIKPIGTNASTTTVSAPAVSTNAPTEATAPIMPVNPGLNVDGIELSNETSKKEAITLKKEEEKEVVERLRKEIEELSNEYKKTKGEQGLIGKAWDGAKNLFGAKTGSNKTNGILQEMEQSLKELDEHPEKIAEVYEKITGKKLTSEELEKFKKDEKILADSKVGQAIEKYKEGQKQSVDLVADLASGLISFGGYTAAVIGGLAAPVTGGASLALVAGGLALATGAGSLSKMAIKYVDAKTGGRKYDSAGYDALSGGVNGILAPITSGFGGAVGKTLTTTFAKQAVKEVAKEGVEQVAQTAVKQGAARTFGMTLKSQMLKPNSVVYEGNIGTKVAGLASEMVTDGALSGGVYNTTTHIYEHGTEGAGGAFIEGAVGGAIAAPIIGGGFKVAGKAGAKISEHIKSKKVEIPATSLTEPKSASNQNPVKLALEDSNIPRSDMANSSADLPSCLTMNSFSVEQIKLNAKEKIQAVLSGKTLAEKLKEKKLNYLYEINSKPVVQASVSKELNSLLGVAEKTSMAAKGQGRDIAPFEQIKLSDGTIVCSNYIEGDASKFAPTHIFTVIKSDGKTSVIQVNSAENIASAGKLTDLLGRISKQNEVNDKPSGIVTASNRSLHPGKNSETVKYNRYRRVRNEILEAKFSLDIKKSGIEWRVRTVKNEIERLEEQRKLIPELLPNDQKFMDYFIMLLKKLKKEKRQSGSLSEIGVAFDNGNFTIDELRTIIAKIRYSIKKPDILRKTLALAEKELQDIDKELNSAMSIQNEWENWLSNRSNTKLPSRSYTRPKDNINHKEILDIDSIRPYNKKSIKLISAVTGTPQERAEKIKEIFLKEMGYAPNLVEIEETMVLGAMAVFNPVNGKMSFKNNFLNSASNERIAIAIRHELDHFEVLAKLAKSIGVDEYLDLLSKSNLIKAENAEAQQLLYKNFNRTFWNKAIETVDATGFNVKRFKKAISEYPKDQLLTQDQASYYSNPLEVSAYMVEESLAKTMGRANSRDIIIRRLYNQIAQTVNFIQKRNPNSDSLHFKETNWIKEIFQEADNGDGRYHTQKGIDMVRFLHNILQDLKFEADTLR